MGAFADGFILGMPRRVSLLAGTGLASLFAAGLTVVSRPASAQLPTGGQVTAGQASISQSGSRMDIVQGTARAAIDWRGFSIGAGNVVHFQQPSSSSVALNRVTGADPSIIAGQLSANGRLVLMNPNGITFSRGSRVDTAGLVATTLGVSTGDFMAGRLRFDQPGRPGAAVVNEGEITVREGGLAALVAPEVRNSGVIRARLGQVQLAGAEGFTLTLDPRGDGLIRFEVSELTTAPGGPSRETRAENTGRIEAAGGTVTISAASARGIVAGVVNVDGQVIATSVESRNGVVSFGSGENGTTTVAGSVDVRGTEAGQRGGRVTATGDRVRVAGTARIDASGRAGGGEVKIGGNLQGRGPEQNARRTLVEQGAVIRADATERGRGGEVIVWSDEYTRFMGGISATGGALGGDGGFAEVSGKIWLGFEGAVDLGAPLGATGTLLLDPTNINIVAADNAGVPDLGSPSGTSPNLFLTVPDPASPPGGNAPPTSEILASTLVALLGTGGSAGANVTISTANTTGTGAGDINVATGITWTTNRTLTLIADAAINVNQAITASAANGNLTLNAGTGISIAAAGTINLGGGTLTASTAAGSITQNAALTAGNMTLQAGSGSADALTLNNGLSAAGGTVQFVANNLAIGVGAPAGNLFAGGLPNEVVFRTAATATPRPIYAGASAATVDPGTQALRLDQTAVIDRLLPNGSNLTIPGLVRIGARGVNNAGTATGEAASGALTVTGIAIGALPDTANPGQLLTNSQRTLVLESGSGNITQTATGSIRASNLEAYARAGAVLLGNAGNVVVNVTTGGGSGAGTIGGRSSGDFVFQQNDLAYRVGATRLGNVSLQLGINAGGVVRLLKAGSTAGRFITQDASGAGITANGLQVVSATSVTLDNTSNAVGQVAASVTGVAQSFTLTNGVGLEVAEVTGGGATVNGVTASGQAVLRAVNGNLTQSAAVTASGVVATADAGSVLLHTAANSVGAVAGTAAQDFRFRDSGGLTVGAADAIEAGNGRLIELTTNGAGTLTVDGSLTVQDGTVRFVVGDLIAGTPNYAGGAPQRVEFQSTTTRAINFGTGAAGAGALNLPTTVLNAMAPEATTRVIRIGAAGLDAASLPTVTGPAGTVTSFGITRNTSGSPTTLILESGASGANAIQQTGAIDLGASGRLVLRNGATDGGATLALDVGGNAVNQAGTLAARVGSGGLTYRGLGSVSVDEIDGQAGITRVAGAASAPVSLWAGGALALDRQVNAGGAAVTLRADGGSITQTGIVTGSDLTADATGGSVLLTAINAIDSVTGSATQDFQIRNSGDLSVNNVTVGTGRLLEVTTSGSGTLTLAGTLSVENGTARFGVGGSLSGTPTYVGSAPSRVEIVPGGGRSISVGTGAAGADLNIDPTLLEAVAPALTTQVLRIGASGVDDAGAATGEAASGFVNVSGISRTGTALILESGAAGANAIRQTGTIELGTTGRLAVRTAAAGGATLDDAGNTAGVVAGRVGAGGFTYRGDSAVEVGLLDGQAGLTRAGGAANADLNIRAAGNVTLTQAVGSSVNPLGAVRLWAEGGSITQTAAVTASSLLARASQDVTLDQANALGTASLEGGAGRSVTLRETDGVTLTTLTGGVLGIADTTGGVRSTTGQLALSDVQTGGGLTVNAAVSADTVRLRATGGGVVSNAGGTVTAVDYAARASTGIAIGGAVNATGAARLWAEGGSITQTAAVTASSLLARASQDVTLDQANALGTASLEGGAGRSVTLRETDGVTLTTLTGGVLGIADTTGGVRSTTGQLALSDVQTGGGLTVNAAVSADTVRLRATGGGVVSNAGGTVTAVDYAARASTGIAIGGAVNATGAARLWAEGGSITQTASVSASSLLARASQDVTLDQANALVTASLEGGAGRSVTLRETDGVTLTTLTGGVLGIADTTGGVRSTTGQLALSDVQTGGGLTVNAAVSADTVRLRATGGGVVSNAGGTVTAVDYAARASTGIAIGGAVNATGAARLWAEGGSITQTASVSASSLLARATDTIDLGLSNQIGQVALETQRSAIAGGLTIIRLRDADGGLTVGSVAGDLASGILALDGIRAVGAGPGTVEANIRTSGDLSLTQSAGTATSQLSFLRLQTDGGSIRQSGTGTIHADSLLARAPSGSIDLAQDAASPGTLMGNQIGTVAMTQFGSAQRVRSTLDLTIGEVGGDAATGIDTFAGLQITSPVAGDNTNVITSGSLVIDRPIDVPLGTTRLQAGGSIGQDVTAGTIHTGQLLARATTNIELASLANAIDVAALETQRSAAAGTANTIRLGDGGGGLAIGQVLADGTFILGIDGIRVAQGAAGNAGGVDANILTDGGDLSLTQSAGTTTSQLRILRLQTDAGSIGQSGVGTIHAGELLARATVDIDLPLLGNTIGVAALETQRSAAAGTANTIRLGDGTGGLAIGGVGADGTFILALDGIRAAGAGLGAVDANVRTAAGDLTLVQSAGTTASQLGILRLQADAGSTGQNMTTGTIHAAELLARASVDVNLERGSNVGAIAGTAGGNFAFRSNRSLRVEAIAGDAALGIPAGDGVTAGREIRISAMAGGGGTTLDVQAPLTANEIALRVETGPAGQQGGGMNVADNTLQPVGSGIVVLDVADRTLPLADVLATFRANPAPAGTITLVGGQETAVPRDSVFLPPRNSGAEMQLNSQNQLSASALYLFANGGSVRSSSSSVNPLSLTVYASSANTIVDLYGTVGGRVGSAAASVSRVGGQAPSRNLRINNCPISGSVGCNLLTISLPGIPPLGESLQVGVPPPRIDDSTLTFINLGVEDSEEREEERRVPVGRPSPRGE
jgi:filamentous hemagglutinin family protein